MLGGGKLMWFSSSLEAPVNLRFVLINSNLRISFKWKAHVDGEFMLGSAASCFK